MTVVTTEYALLRDGRQVLLRPYVPGDSPAVAALFAGLSPQSRLLRFHSAGVAVDQRTIEPELAEMDISPALVRPLGEGVLALDAR